MIEVTDIPSATIKDTPWGVRDSIREQIMAPPRKGTPAADLTDRERIALAIAAGAPITSEMEGGMLHFRTAVPVGIADRGDGGYIVAIGSRAEA